MHRLVGDWLRLRHYGQPIGGFERIEGINGAITRDVAILFFPDFGNQLGLIATTGLGVGLKISRE